MSVSSIFQHLWLDPRDAIIEVTTNGCDVVVKIGADCTFMTLNQFAELKYQVNKFDVKEVKASD